MNEVEKMYKLANVKAINIAEYGSTYIPNGIEIDGKFYPPFTAEKQLELIKWLAIKGDFDYTLDIVKKYALIINTLDTDAYYTMYFNCTRCTAETFEEALAGLINNMWQDITEEEYKQIKEILE